MSTLVLLETSRKLHGLTTDVVLRLVDPGLGLKLGAGYQLCVDNFYTSRILFEKLLENKILACGTLRRNGKGYPKQLANTVQKSYRGDFRWVRDGQLTYYEWNDNSQVLFFIFHMSRSEWLSVSM